MRYRPHVSRRRIRNQCALLDTLANGVQLVVEKGRKRGPQAEGSTNKIIAAWRKLRPSIFLERNKRRLATPVGMTEPIMLGWMADGSGDWGGWESVTITPEMVGHKVAVAFWIEAKRQSGGRTQDNQKEFMRMLKEAGGMTGVARTAEDCERIRQEWRASVCAPAP